MKKLIFSLAALLFVSSLFAQERYIDEITDSVTVGTYTYIQKDGQQLDLDLYTPALDSETKRPVIIYVHGGGFYAGTRNSPEIVTFCNKIARRGYVVASISYRLLRKGTKTLFGCDCPAQTKLATIDAAVEDLQDATFFLIQHRESFGIDPQEIIISGSSAGAETVLAAAYQPPYCYGLDSGPVQYAGVVSMAGAIADTSKIYNESAIPSMLFHGTCDNLVPYGTAPHHYCSEGNPGYLIMHGSKTIADKLEALGKPFWLYTICGGNHSVAGTPMTEYFDQIMTFCHDFVLKHSLEQIHTIIPGKHNCDYPKYNYCDN
ncbi:MAG TPA: carboxylesterase family protein [Sunxiuqinia sp.]|nr:carboxylesterase family protein [Sunxiuqinia sp.]